MIDVNAKLDRDVYPDCDMVTAVIPANFATALKSMGCRVDFWDTTYMCTHRPNSGTSLDFQRDTGRPFLRNCGDHCLLLARKPTQAPT
jgi:trans-aconitate methyltransferase